MALNTWYITHCPFKNKTDCRSIKSLRKHANVQKIADAVAHMSGDKLYIDNTNTNKESNDSDKINRIYFCIFFISPNFFIPASLYKWGSCPLAHS